jgi:hypothetical protein
MMIELTTIAIIKVPRAVVVMTMFHSAEMVTQLSVVKNARVNLGNIMAWTCSR